MDCREEIKKSDIISGKDTVTFNQTIFHVLSPTNTTRPQNRIANMKNRNSTSWLCLNGNKYGGFGNNVISLWNAQFLASRRGLRVSFLEIPSYVRQIQLAFEGENTDVDWEQKPIEKCSDLITWEAAFTNTFGLRSIAMFFDNPPPLASHFRLQAQEALTLSRPNFTVHGRSFEGVCDYTTEQVHAPYSCKKFTHNLCESYDYQSMLTLFNLAGNALLFTDGQCLSSIQTYGDMVDQHDFYVQLWMMVLSNSHIGNPGSSLDYLVWLWKRKYNPDSVMYPKECYEQSLDS